MEPILQNTAYQKILFVGIGNVLKKDDGIGVYITNHIKNTNRIRSLTVEVSIENYIGKINSIAPDLLILVDCMDLLQEPGCWKILPASQIKGHITNTHNISLNRVSELFNSPVYILGVQPSDISLGETITQKVKESGDELIEKINRVGLMTGIY